MHKKTPKSGKELKKFLRSKGALGKFKRNIRRLRSTDRGNVTDIALYNTPESLISSAFYWEDAQEGFNFWGNINLEYTNTLF